MPRLKGLLLLLLLSVGLMTIPATVASASPPSHAPSTSMQVTKSGPVASPNSCNPCGGAQRLIDRATDRCLDSNGSGSVYTLPCNGGNYQLWTAVQDYPYSQYYWVDFATGRCLQGGPGEPGGVSTQPCDHSGSGINWARQNWNCGGNNSYGDCSWGESAAEPEWRVLDSNANGNVYLLPPNGGNYQFWHN